ncbi:hypothetical protein PTSG_02331 [Salpingoeca rosetta]|uniref:PRELI/MSF1 domain-containing protein n=1 Tax=Salpingoeca rosetta (strain ATCC 50818 / BSB-021) TaxID=946362 RepID=F2U1W2_SALR5|nr:uncharacterized protein PTSG_02331 [Salpingoeca rosetta]EGD81614.1 hypothetical protein PTSG_02331 [Salpingoeca rosetta]|eukprot:XP_004996818.1 hypothetical protein PTSG_02331 [Salpingoeca rosetta]
MVKIWQTQHIFDHPWTHVTSGHWRKYPNPYNPAVLSTDIVDRKVEDGVLHSKRLITTNFQVPGWVRRLIGCNCIHAIEESKVDPRTQSLEMVSKNVTFCNLLNVKESITYSPDPSDPNKTVMTQKAEVSVPSMTYVEKTLTDSIAKNSKKGKEAMEWVIAKIAGDLEELS